MYEEDSEGERMRRLTAFVRRAVVLPLPIALPLGAALCALMVLGLMRGASGPLALLSYLAAAYALAVLSAAVPRAVRGVRAWIGRNRFARLLLDAQFVRSFRGDIRFRAMVSLRGGFFINLGYIAVKLILGIRYRSVWFIALAVYYALLALMRYLLLRRGELDARGAWKRYRACGILLLMMNQALMVIVALIKYRNNGYVYPGNLIYVMAVYAFYAVILAITKLIRSHREGDPIYSASRVLSLVAAMVSILSLETAMMSRFGGDDPVFRQVMTSVSGGWICLVVLAMAIYMIARSRREIALLAEGMAQQQ